MGKTRRKYRTKRKSRKRSRGGVGTTAQAAALSQVFQGLTNRNEYSDLLSEVLSHQPVEDRDNVERKQRRTMAREKVITELLAKINGTVEPDLVKRILRQSRPSHPLQREIRERGQNMTEAIQEELDNINFVDRYNSQSLRNAIRQMYPHLDPNNLPPGILMPPHRQLAEPTRRYSSLLQ
jgi:hypothetical protein